MIDLTDQLSDLLWDHAEVQQIDEETVMCTMCGALWHLDIYQEEFEIALQHDGNGECAESMFQA